MLMTAWQWTGLWNGNLVFDAAARQYQKKEDCTIPMVAVSQPYCFAMGKIAMLILTLSMLHSIKAIKHSPMMVHRLFHLLLVPAACDMTSLLFRTTSCLLINMAVAILYIRAVLIRSLM